MQGVFELSFFADGRLIIPIPPAERLSFLHSTAFTFGSKLVSVQVYLGSIYSVQVGYYVPIPLPVSVLTTASLVSLDI